MKIINCTKQDYNQIILNIEEFWGSDRTLYLHHPIFIFEFGNTAFMIKEKDNIIAYLFGFLSQTEPTAYVHLLGVKSDLRRQGLATKLYNHFINYAIDKGCKKLKALTSPKNKDSIAFHISYGMKLLGEPNENGVPIIRNYSGPGRDNIVFEKIL